VQTPNSSNLIKIGSNGTQLDAGADTFLATLNPATGLMAAVGAIADELTYAEAEAALGLLNADSYAGFNDWRLPTVQELFSLVDHSRHSPAADPAFYPDTKSDWYWSSTPVAWSSDHAWIVNFGLGHVDDYGRDYAAFVRPVRAVSAGQ
jgi:hypothetical protein